MDSEQLYSGEYFSKEQHFFPKQEFQNAVYGHSISSAKESKQGVSIPEWQLLTPGLLRRNGGQVVSEWGSECTGMSIIAKSLAKTVQTVPPISLFCFHSYMKRKY